MSDLVVVGFDDKFQAEEVLMRLLEHENLIALDDAVVVTRNKAGKIRVKAYHDLTEPTPELGNELWGGIISSIVFHRELQIAQGVFDPNFLTQVEASLKPNSSALFVLVGSFQIDAVLEALSGVNGQIIQTTLPESAQLKLQEALRGSA
jgi:uncharacterized membrane protein